MRDFRIWLAAAGLLLAGWLACPILVGDRSVPVRDDELQKFVFVCRESGETFVMRAKTSPAAHPRTGKMTLLPGLYCKQCDKWRISPPLDVVQQNPSARMCPTHKVPMSSDCPVPTSN